MFLETKEKNTILNKNCIPRAKPYHDSEHTYYSIRSIVAILSQLRRLLATAVGGRHIYRPSASAATAVTRVVGPLLRRVQAGRSGTSVIELDRGVHRRRLRGHR